MSKNIHEYDYLGFHVVINFITNKIVVKSPSGNIVTFGYDHRPKREDIGNVFYHIKNIANTLDKKP